MTAALAYLTRRSLANQLRRQIARVRSPRYALALLLGLGWLAVVIWQRSYAAAPRQAWLELGAQLGILLLVAWTWLGAADGRALAFSPAEATFLLPGPISRVGLLHYKLARTQLVVILNVVIWTALTTRPGGYTPSWQRAASFWVLLTTLSLHRLAAALVRRSVTEHGRFGLRHRAVSVGLAAIAAAALGSGLWTAWPDLVAAARVSGAAFREALTRVLDHPGIAIVLWPFRTLARPLAAGSVSEWRAAMLPALGLLVAHYVWVLRSDVAFEEAAAEASLARARRQAARRSGAVLVEAGQPRPSRPLFPLAPTGWPATALLWKNLAAVLRRRRARNVLVVAGTAGGIAAITSSNPDSTLSQLVGALALTWFGFVLVLGPQWVRNDLRGDLLYADLLRSYPLPGWAVVAMEATASAITLTLLELVLAGVAYLAFLGDPSLELAPADRAFLLGAAVLVLPVLNLVAMLLQNGAAVLFPAWVRIGAPAGGIEALGQQLLGTTALWLLLAAILAIPVGLGFVVLRMPAPLGPVTRSVLAGGVALLALGGEAAAIARWLGRAFERGG